jgi:spermidine synthase
MQTNFQNIHVWEVLHSSFQSVEKYELSTDKNAENYFTQNPELFSPNRLLFLDGVMQSTSRGDEAYHESLVHPAMFAHALAPKRAAIIGGGEGATLREILKHKSIETCVMIEIDPDIIQASRQWLPRMNDCSDFGSGNCFDESRADLRVEDAFAWFTNNFNSDSEKLVESFDVIVMDALDPEDNVPFAIQLYQDYNFWRIMYDALTDDGTLVVQLGMSPRSYDYAEQFGRNKNRANLFATIESVGFQKLMIYQLIHSDFKYEWSFVVACKSGSCAKEWHRNEAEFNLRIRERILKTRSGSPALSYFDGATMQYFRRPTKAWEKVYCRRNPTPTECSLFHGISDLALSSLSFSQVAKENDDFFVVARKSLSKGQLIFNDNLDISLMSSPFHPGNFTTVKITQCGGLFKKLLPDAAELARVSPLDNRQHLFHNLDVLTQDILIGERILCSTSSPS